MEAVLECLTIAVNSGNIMRKVACVVGVIGAGDGEGGRQEKMRGIGERGPNPPATESGKYR